ncbi:MAG TPA: carboxypeptidase regulatory-like domain-containing protein [Pyrinomonadaceae bacterium]|nr:carboxypeptidase regulatory-like domain-containing protein [Pyrinomonadaceae bacterium]
MNRHRRAIPLARLLASLAIILIAITTATTKPSHASRTHPVAPVNVPNGVTLNLADFGAVGDGVADDGPSFQSALNALALAGGGTLFVPAGHYFVGTPVAKDFSSLTNGTITIQGVPSDTMPAPPTAPGNELSRGLNLTSEIISAAGPNQITFFLSNLQEVRLEHLAFLGRPFEMSDALTTIHLQTIDKAMISHCEFYGISTFSAMPEYGVGNIVRAVNSNLSIELSVFLGCTANSGGYGAVVANLLWRKFSISNSIFLDYGQRPGFFSKTGLGAPLSWIDIGNAAPPTPSSPRREFVVLETFLDEGGWVGISAFPRRWGSTAPIDLVYISGLKANVPNMGTTGHMLYDIENLMIETSHYGWSTNAYAAVDIHRTGNAILDKLTCIDHANQISVDAGTNRLAVINSVYANLNSQAPITTVLNTTPEDDPVQYVRQQFLSTLGRQPDPAAHFYWSDLLVRCEQNNDCQNQQRTALADYLANQPQANFSINGTARDEDNNPLSGVLVTLSGSQSVSTVTDAQGNFQFSDLPTSGTYTIAATRQNYNFGSSQTFALPPDDVTTTFVGQRNRYSISGRLTDGNGTGIDGILVRLNETASTTTEADGSYAFTMLPAGQSYTVTPSSSDFDFSPSSVAIQDLSSDQSANFTGIAHNISINGNVVDENGAPVRGATVSLSGSQSNSALTGLQGEFQFGNLPTTGTYTVTITKQHYSFATASQSFVQPVDDVMVEFAAQLNHHAITGRITQMNGSGIGGVLVRLNESTAYATTDASGYYSFVQLPAGENYTVIPVSTQYSYAPLEKNFSDLGSDQTADFAARLTPVILTLAGTDTAIALESTVLLPQPFSVLNALGLSVDGYTRIMIFAKNLEQIDPPLQTSLVAEDDQGNVHPLSIEYVGVVPGQSWLKQINVKLSPDLVNGSCVKLQISAAGSQSNKARICIGGAAP